MLSNSMYQLGCNYMPLKTIIVIAQHCMYVLPNMISHAIETDHCDGEHCMDVIPKLISHAVETDHGDGATLYACDTKADIACR